MERVPKPGSGDADLAPEPSLKELCAEERRSFREAMEAMREAVRLASTPPPPDPTATG